MTAASDNKSMHHSPDWCAFTYGSSLIGTVVIFVVIQLAGTSVKNRRAIDIPAAVAQAMAFVAPKKYCKCKVTSVLKYKPKPTDSIPTAYSIELEADYSRERIAEIMAESDSDSGADVLSEMMSRGPFRIRVVTDGQKIFDAGHFDDYIAELEHNVDID